MSNSSEVRGCNGSKLICGRFYGEAGGQVEEGRWVQLATDLEQTHISKAWQVGKSIRTKVISGNQWWGEESVQVEEGRWVLLATDLEQTHICKKMAKALGNSSKQ